jgi:monothiol glutaredoxin
MQDILNKIKKDITENKVVLYMKGDKDFPMCGFSASVCNILDSLKVEYKDFNVLENEELREGIKQYTNWPTIPQLYINGEFIGGCDIVNSLYQNGELQKLLSK